MNVDQEALATLAANIKRDTAAIEELLKDVSPEEREQQLTRYGLMGPQQSEQTPDEQEVPRQK